MDRGRVRRINLTCDVLSGAGSVSQKIMSVECNRCDNRFETKGKRNRHVIEKHVFMMTVDKCHFSHIDIYNKITKGNNCVSHSSGFPCPCCRKYLRNAKILKDHLAKKQLPCLFVYNSVDPIAPQVNPRKSLSALHVETTASANMSDEPLSIASTTPNISTASTPSVPSPTSSSLFSSPASSTVFAELGLSSPSIEYRLPFNSIDVSARFYGFQLDMHNRLQEGIAITIEEHMQHILALSSVLLLKPARTHRNLHKHIDINTCEALRRHILSEQQPVYLPFPASTRARLEEIMEQMDMLILVSDKAPVKIYRLNDF